MRNISATLAPIIAGSSAIPRMLYHMEMQDKATGAINHLYLTNHEANLSFGSITYQSYRIKHSSIKTYLKNQTDNTTVTIDNVDKGMSSYFAYNEFAGQNSTIWKIFLDPATLVPLGTFAAGDYIIQAQGMMDRPKVNEERCEVRIVNIFNREQSYTPWRRFSAKCNWDFCDTECGYNSANGKARGTATHAGTTTTLRDTGLGTFATGYWIGASLKILSGTNRGEIRYIYGYDATTKTFTVESAFPLATDTTSKYIVECDKSKGTCRGYAKASGGTVLEAGNSIYFGGVFRPPYALLSQEVAAVLTGNKILPYVYGRGMVPGVLLDYAASLGKYRNDVFGFCSGEIEAIEEIKCNGKYINTNDTKHVQKRMGLRLQSLYASDFTSYGANRWMLTSDNYFPQRYSQMAFAGIITYHDTHTLVDKDSLGDWVDIFTWRAVSDEVLAIVKGLKVQKYLANGATDGSPVWSQNPVWCLLDFLVKRAEKKLDPVYINFAYAKAAADLCDTLGYKLNLVIKEQKKDPEIIGLMLNACRGYNTYQTGKMEISLERAWAHPVLLDSTPAHYFDDASSGKTQDNIDEGSFDYFEEDVNDTPNKIVVKYIDQEIRENMALVSSSLLAGVPRTSIPYSDIKGTFPTTFPFTGYIGAESFPVTANNGTVLTISSWTPSKTYPKGYPLFQGAQTFPTETAIYHDYDNQDRVKRVIEKEIDGSAIPTYKQAYNIAEYHGRKSVEGNMKCSFKGHMDSLGLTVGDVVKLTHALPGWVDEEFRITEASESEDEEVDYALELYDPSFYAESDPIPGANLGTILPNPWGTPGQVTSPILLEDGYKNTDGTYTPTLTLTYTMPFDNASIFWDRARIQIAVNGGAYSDYGIDISRGLGFSIDANNGKFKVGDTVSVKIISINSNNVQGDAATAATVSNIINGLISDEPTVPRGLRIEGNPNPNDTEWDGRRVSVTWWKQSQTGGAGREGSLGAGGLQDIYWNCDEYELWVGGSCIDKGTTKSTRYDYVHGDGYLDFLDDKIVAAHGAITFKIRRLWFNQPSDWASITITQKSPAAPTNFLASLNGSQYILSWGSATEADFSHYTLTLNGIPWRLTDNWYQYIFISSGDQNIAYSLTVSDIYGNVSSPVSGTIFIDSPDVASLTSQVIDNNVLLFWSGVKGTFPIAGYEIRKTRGSDPIEKSSEIGTLTGTFTTVFETSSGTYKYWVRAVDTAGLKGEYKTISTVVNQPPDYLLNADDDDMFSGTKTNFLEDTLLFYHTITEGTVNTTASSAVVTGEDVSWLNDVFPGDKLQIFEDIVYTILSVDSDKQLTLTENYPTTRTDLSYSVFAQYLKKFYVCGNTTQTFEEYSGTLGGTTMQEFIDTGGYAYLMEPMLTTATYEKTIDYVATLGSSSITVALTEDLLLGAVTVIPTISISTNGIAWTPYVGNWQIYVTSFRYVKIELAFSGTGENILELSNLNIRLDVKLKSESGTDSVSTASTGKLVKFTKDFSDIAAITVTASMTAGDMASRIAVYDFMDNYATTAAGSTTTLVNVSTGEGSEFQVNDWIPVPIGEVKEVVQVTAIATDQLTVSPALSSAPPAGVSIYHASFTAYLFDSGGTKVTGNFSWKAEGY